MLPLIDGKQISPTGRHTYRFSLADHLALQVGTPTVESADWDMPHGLTEISSSVTTNTVTVTVETDDLALGTYHEAVCSVTLSDGQVQSFHVRFACQHLRVE
jgi:hypothetical protein